MRSNPSKRHNYNTQSDAFSLFKAIDDFDFIANVVIIHEVLQLSLLVTQLLQSKKNDIADGTHMITSLIYNVRAIRSKVDDFHKKCFLKAKVIADRLNIPLSKPRTNKRQIYRDNHPSNGVSDYYKVSLTIPLLDTLEQELTTRFYDNSLACYSGMYLIPSKIVDMQKHPLQKKPLKELCRPLIAFYRQDLPFPHRIEVELDLWERFWISQKKIFPTNYSETLKAVTFTGFDNIKELLIILGSLPLTSCECERTFSGMKRVKTCLRCRMLQARMNGLSLLNFHLDKVPDSERVCDRYLATKSRLIDR